MNEWEVEKAEMPEAEMSDLETDMEVLEDDIIHWNFIRNGLKFDHKLEKRLLAEEFYEVMIAPTLPHALQEYADLMFVAIGTEAKMEANEVSDEAIGIFIEELDSLYTWAARRIKKDFPEVQHMDLPWLGKEALRYVTEANMLKPVDKTENKVEKGVDYVSPLNNIKAMVESYG